MPPIGTSAALTWTGGGPRWVAKEAMARGMMALHRWWRVVSTRPRLADLDEQLLRDIGITQAQCAAELARAPWDITPRR